MLQRLGNGLLFDGAMDRQRMSVSRRYSRGSMNRPRQLGLWLACMWPGVPRLLDEAQGLGFVWALGFSVLLNSWILFTFVWQQWIPDFASIGLGIGTAVVWCLFLVRQLWFRRQLAVRQSEPGLGLFLDARTEYLRGNLAGAEQKLNEVISQRPEDLCSRLMIVSVLRRQGKVREAREQLRRLQRWRAASAWQLEIRREWELLARREYRGSRSVESSGKPNSFR